MAKINIDGVDFNLEQIVVETYLKTIALQAYIKSLHLYLNAYIANIQGEKTAAALEKQFQKQAKVLASKLFAQSQITQTLMSKVMKNFLKDIEGIDTSGL